MSNGKYLIDTILINKLILQEKGVLSENIESSQMCTVCNSEILHSYRVDKESSGRNLSLIAKKGENV